MGAAVSPPFRIPINPPLSLPDQPQRRLNSPLPPILPLPPPRARPPPHKTTSPKFSSDSISRHPPKAGGAPGVPEGSNKKNQKPWTPGGSADLPSPPKPPPFS